MEMVDSTEVSQVEHSWKFILKNYWIGSILTQIFDIEKQLQIIAEDNRWT